jgi:hypothetical protein
MRKLRGANCVAGGNAPAMQSPPQAPKSARFPITENARVSPSLCRARDTFRKPPTIMAAAVPESDNERWLDD